MGQNAADFDQMIEPLLAAPARLRGDSSRGREGRPCRAQSCGAKNDYRSDPWRPDVPRGVSFAWYGVADQGRASGEGYASSGIINRDAVTDCASPLRCLVERPLGMAVLVHRWPNGGVLCGWLSDATGGHESPEYVLLRDLWLHPRAGFV